MYYSLFGRCCQAQSRTCNCHPQLANQPRNNSRQCSSPKLDKCTPSLANERKGNNMLIKNAVFGGIALPKGTEKGATFHVASLTLDNSEYQKIHIQLAFSCNIITDKLKVRLRFQLFRQEWGHGISVPISAGILYYRDKVCSEADSFTLSICDFDSAACICCYNVFVDIEDLDPYGNTMIANPSLIAITIVNA